MALAMAGSAMATFYDESDFILQGKKIDLGHAGRVYKWAALSVLGNVSASTTTNTSPGNISITGNVGVWGSGSQLVLTNSRAGGDLYIRVGGTESLTGSGGWNGAKYQNADTDSMILKAAAANVKTLSDNIYALTKTTNFSLTGISATPSTLTKIVSSGTSDNTTSINLTIDGTGTSNPLNEPIVLKLTDFVLNEVGGTQLTLVGTAMTKFIINVTGAFSLANSADIILSGGLLASNVIFNTRGTSGAGLSGGSTLQGLLVAKNGTASLAGGSKVTGMVIGKAVSLTGGSKIQITSP